MDQKTAAAFVNVLAILDRMAAEQKRQGEALARIVSLLTAEPEEKPGPTAQELLAQMLATMERQGAGQGEYLKRILGEAVGIRRNTPLETVQAIHDNLDLPRKAA